MNLKNFSQNRLVLLYNLVVKYKYPNIKKNILRYRCLFNINERENKKDSKKIGIKISQKIFLL